MFTSDVCEAKQEEIKMEGIDPSALWDLVQFAYTGKVRGTKISTKCDGNAHQVRQHLWRKKHFDVPVSVR